MIKIILYQDNGKKGNKKILEEIAKEIFEANCSKNLSYLSNVTASFAKRNGNNEKDVFDLLLNSESFCLTYVIEIQKSRSGRYQDNYYSILRRE